ncbi:hypothetical protein [Sphingobium yanoikuyae]|uniref:hypothetical protein n=1 Tax=Sphingobium yanoikuyae TaxID=13690 RepID=UPI003F019C13
MSRARLDYSLRSDAQAEGLDPDKPIAGHYRMRLRSGAAYCGVRIWHGAPLDPVTGEELDRSHRWQAQANGEDIALDRVWPKCGADPIDVDEYRHLCAVQDWAREHAPTSPQANPHRKADALSSPILF